MINLFDKKVQKEIEEHCGEPKHPSHHTTIEPKPWDSHYVSDFYLWRTLRTIFYVVAWVLTAISIVIITYAWTGSNMLLGAGIIKSLFH